jgi:hypothetical protein
LSNEVDGEKAVFSGATPFRSWASSELLITEPDCSEPIPLRPFLLAPKNINNMSPAIASPIQNNGLRCGAIKISSPGGRNLYF